MNEQKIARELVQLARELVSKEKRIDVVKRIIDESQAEKIDGYLIDLTTAGMLKVVYDALKPQLQKKFDKIPLKKLVDFGWSMVK